MPVVDERVARIEGRMDQLQQVVGVLRTDMAALRTEMSGLRGEMAVRFDRFEDRTARQFLWLLGLHVATLTAVVGALLARG